jgi:archaemetzincin
VIAIHQQEGLEVFDALRPVIKTHLGLDAVRAASFPIPGSAFDPLRNQYSAHRLALSIRANGKAQYHLLIVDIDLYARGMNFIFGQADPMTRIAIVSTYRLKGPLSAERLAKEAVHEVFHLQGLGHCREPSCIMFLSNTIEDTDHKTIDLCSNCRRQLENL